MIEISTSRDDRVYVRWAPGGPWTVLDRDGRVTTEAHDLAATPWHEEPDGESRVTRLPVGPPTQRYPRVVTRTTAGGVV